MRLEKEAIPQYIYQEKHYSCYILHSYSCFCDLRENIKGMMKVNVLTETQIYAFIDWKFGDFKDLFCKYADDYILKNKSFFNSSCQRLFYNSLFSK